LNFDAQRKAKASAMGYFYFRIHPSFKREGVRAVSIEVEYCSPVRGMFGLDYDAIAPERTLHSIYTHAPAVRLDGSNKWQTATFHVKDAAFENAQNGGADFRLWVRPPDLYVRKVVVTREQVENLTQ
jgi:hypothetical protein